MKKLLTGFLALVMILNIAGITGCSGSEDSNTEDEAIDETTLSQDENAENAAEDEFKLYNKLAEEFVALTVSRDFDAAVGMFDTVMQEAVPALDLQSSWDSVVSQAGEFVDIYKTENSVIDGYYICTATIHHETIGVIWRIVFSEDGLISGLFAQGYCTIPEGIIKRSGFTDYPVIIGEGTAYPLNAVLSVPDNVSGKVPAVVLVHGSGAHDMDETTYANKPFSDIAEYLAQNGIAVIRYDKRNYTHGMIMSQELGGNFTVNEETIQDAVLASELLKSDSRIDENKVFILGHSLGGMLAPRIHSEGGNFAGIISLAGSPRLFLEITYDQNIAYIDEMPEGSEKQAALSSMAGYDEQFAALRSLSDDEAKNTPMGSGISFYYYKEMESHPASEYVKNIDVPFLIMQGEKDIQVYADKDYTAWQDLLGDRDNVTFKLYNNLNHMFMTSTGDTILERHAGYQIESHVDSQVLSDIADWIKGN